MLRWQHQVLEQGGLVLFGAGFGLAVQFLGRHVRFFACVARRICGKRLLHLVVLVVQNLHVHHLHLLDEEIARGAAVCRFLRVGDAHTVRVRLLSCGLLRVLREFVETETRALARHRLDCTPAHQVLAPLDNTFAARLLVAGAQVQASTALLVRRARLNVAAQTLLF